MRQGLGAKNHEFTGRYRGVSDIGVALELQFLPVAFCPAFVDAVEYQAVADDGAGEGPGDRFLMLEAFLGPVCDDVPELIGLGEL